MIDLAERHTVESMPAPDYWGEDEGYEPGPVAERVVVVDFPRGDTLAIMGTPDQLRALAAELVKDLP